MRRVDGLAGRLAATGAAAIALALFVGEGGCELEVGDTIPDYDCQPASAGAPDPCPPSLICSVGTHKCVSASAPCQPTCPSGMQCDRVTAQCTVRLDASVPFHKPDAGAHLDAGDARAEAAGDEGLGDTGEAGGNDAMWGPEISSDCRGLTCACAGASFCDSNLCSAMQTVTAPVAELNNNINFCTKPCCTSADCTTSTVCFAAGTGGNYCISPASIGRVAPLGTSIGGVTCKIASDCRSGLCVNGTCADTCCSTTDQGTECATGSICRFSTFPGNVSDTHYTAWCSPPGNGTVAGGGACGLDGVCASNRCGVAIAYGCETACRSSKDCGSSLACAYTAGPFMSKDLAAGCVPMMGNGAEGTSCRTNNDCATNFCDTTGSPSGTMGHCSSVCFADSDCTIKDWHCRPANVTLANVPYYVLSCGT